MRRKILFIIIFLSLGYLLAMFFNRPSSPAPDTVQAPAQIPAANQNTQPVQSNKEKNNPPSLAVPSAITETIKLNVPFSVQAPFGNWSDPVFQNACEEDSIVMAMGWINGVPTISSDSAQKKILDIVNFENRTFGYNADTDVFDVQKIFQQYFHQQNISVQENITVSDINQELQKGNLVLVPAFGQALGNPNYTAPGPVEHMLVIIGYDPTTKEFITNDSGTRHGSGYRYNENVLWKAIWEYPSSQKAVPAPTGVFKKAMIVVSK